MLQAAPTCPECGSRHSRWRPGPSANAAVDYCQCDACGVVWVLDEDSNVTLGLVPATPDRRSQHPTIIFLYVDLDAGMLFAEMAQKSDDPVRRRELARRALNALETVERLYQRVRMPDHDRERLLNGAKTLRGEMAKIPGSEYV